MNMDLESFISKSIEKATGQSLNLNDSMNYFVTYGDDVNRNRIFVNDGNVDRMTQIMDTLKSGQKVFITLPDLKYHTMDTVELIIKNGVPTLQIPKLEYDAMLLSVREIRDRINETGESRNDSNEFKEFKAKLNEIVDEGIPKDKDAYYNTLNELSIKAFAYGFAKLDQSMNARREARFVQASQILEIYRAVCFHEKPSVENMNKNMIASKYLKVRFMNDLKSKDPAIASKACSVLDDNTKFNTEIHKFTETAEFKNMLSGLSSKEIEKLSRKNANDIAKMMDKTKQKSQDIQI